MTAIACPRSLAQPAISPHRKLYGGGLWCPDLTCGLDRWLLRFFEERDYQTGRFRGDFARLAAKFGKSQRYLRRVATALVRRGLMFVDRVVCRGTRIFGFEMPTAADATRTSQALVLGPPRPPHFKDLTKFKLGGSEAPLVAEREAVTASTPSPPPCSITPPEPSRPEVARPSEARAKVKLAATESSPSSLPPRVDHPHSESLTRAYRRLFKVAMDRESFPYEPAADERTREGERMKVEARLRALEGSGVTLRQFEEVIGHVVESAASRSFPAELLATHAILLPKHFAREVEWLQKQAAGTPKREGQSVIVGAASYGPLVEQGDPDFIAFLETQGIDWRPPGHIA